VTSDEDGSSWSPSQNGIRRKFYAYKPQEEIPSNEQAQTMESLDLELKISTPNYSMSSSHVAERELLMSTPFKMERSKSVLEFIQSGDLRVVPIIGIDFSLGNLTHKETHCLHSTNPSKQNDYRDLLQMVSQSYANVLNLPIFGFGAKTSPYSPQTSSLFPLSRSLRNPFTPNNLNLVD